MAGWPTGWVNEWEGRLISERKDKRANEQVSKGTNK